MEFNRPGIMPHGFVDSTDEPQRVGEIDVGVNPVGLDAQGPGPGGNGFIGPTGLGEGNGEAAIGPRLIRVDFERFAKGRHRVIQVAQSVVGRSALRQPFGEIRLVGHEGSPGQKVDPRPNRNPQRQTERLSRGDQSADATQSVGPEEQQQR